jgi:hypothetical protein
MQRSAILRCIFLSTQRTTWDMPRKVVTFSSQDTYVDEGTYTGDFNSGVTITWDHGEWTEKFINKSGSRNATMIDGNGFDWEYTVCDIAAAQKRLDELR